MAEHTNPAAARPDRTIEELEHAFAELAEHYDKAVRQLEHATRLIAQQGQQYGEAIAWLKDIRQAAGATAPGISHRELCLQIQDMRRRAFLNEAEAISQEGR